MNVLSFLFPRVIEEVYSSINGKIKIVDHFGKKHIQVEGLTQSGGLLKNVWEKALNVLKAKGQHPKTVLVLGVGGGTVIELINGYFPEAQITGVEIDEQMIKLGNKYFRLSERKNTRIIISDAYKWINEGHHGIFDLILVDMYVGKYPPEEIKDPEFIKKLKTLLSPGGTIVFNRLRNKDNKEEIDQFITKLKSLFSEVYIEKPLVNYLIFCK